MLKTICLLFAFLFYNNVIFSQSAHVQTDHEADFIAIRAQILNEKYEEAYPKLLALSKKIGNHPTTEQQYLFDDVAFYLAECELELQMESGVFHAQQFFNNSNNEIRKKLLRFYLGHYYFQIENYSSCIAELEKSSIYNLSNERIADMKFELAYAYFYEKKFESAKPLFNEIHQITSHKYYLPANYYYGFICYFQHEYPDALKAFRVVETDERYNPVVPYYIAEIFYAEDQKEDALIYVDSVLSGTGGAYYRKELELMNAQLYFERKQYTRALPLFELFAQKNEKISKEVLYELSFCYYKANRAAEAISGFKQLSSEKDSMGQNSMYILGELYLKSGDKSNARSAFQFCASNNSNPDQKRISQLNYAKLSYELGFQDLALTEVKQFIADYDKPNLPPVESNLVVEAKELLMSILAKTNDYEEGIRIYNTLSQTSVFARQVYARLLFGMAMQWLNENRTEQAEEALIKIVNNDEAEFVMPFAYYWLGEISYQKQKYSDAIRYLNQYQNKTSSSLGDANPLNALYTLGYSYFQTANYPEALKSFEKIVPQKQSGFTQVEQDALLRKADCYYMLRDYPQAKSLYSIIANGSYNQADYATYQLAMVAGVKDNEEKMKQLKSLLNNYPKSTWKTEVQLELAQTYLALERYSDAIPYLKELIASDLATSIKPRAYLKLGLAYYNKNDNAEALNTLKNLLKQFPQSPETEEATSVIRDICVEDGDPAKYISIMKENGLVVQETEADSLSFTSAFMKYQQGEWVNASKGLADYILEYPNGSNWVKANFYQGICLLKKKDTIAAMDCFRAVKQKGVSSWFDDAVLELARDAYFRQSDFASAKALFNEVYLQSSNAEKKLDALRGMARCWYKEKDYSSATTGAAALLENKGISVDDKSLAWYLIAKSKQQQNDELGALDAFKTVAKLHKGIWGAEARYELALSLFKKGNYNLAEKAAMDVIQETGAFDEWVTKAYILLGDIFFKQKDYFNAKATFESIATHSNIEELKKEAAEKLEAAKLEEKKSSKIGN
jgi:TolA-binding protein